ncbi:MAG: hypothetical protein ABUJ98_13895 [Hyphomicrobium sp.]|jgi:hypothetical protein
MRVPISLLLLAPLVLIVSIDKAGAASLEGTWSGSGMANPKDGKPEKLRCRISYSRHSEKVYSVAAACATTSVKFRQTGKLLKVSPTRYVGDFYNPEYDVSGRVRVIVRGSAQTVTFKSARGNGSATLSKR